ncbi:MAG TPA: hypothetical protein VGB57_02215, partial [Allosphingosinicella sp.]
MESGERPVELRVAAGPSPWPAMILDAKFIEKVPDSMNFVNFAGKSPCFQSSCFPPRCDGIKSRLHPRPHPGRQENQPR